MLAVRLNRVQAAGGVHVAGKRCNHGHHVRCQGSRHPFLVTGRRLRPGLAPDLERFMTRACSANTRRAERIARGHGEPDVVAHLIQEVDRGTR